MTLATLAYGDLVPSCSVVWLLSKHAILWGGSKVSMSFPCYQGYPVLQTEQNDRCVHIYKLEDHCPLPTFSHGLDSRIRHVNGKLSTFKFIEHKSETLCETFLKTGSSALLLIIPSFVPKQEFPGATVSMSQSLCCSTDLVLNSALPSG